MNIKQLTKQLIKIPSYVNNDCGEEKVGDFIYEYLRDNTSLTVIKQKVEGKRNNIIAYSPSCVSNNKLNVETIFIDHIDTVEPKNGWEFNQFEGKEIDGKLYGLGTYDTKGNVAVLMKLAEKIKKEKVMFLFYCDEEYDFKGMKSFIKEYKDKLKVKKIISTDGSSMQIRNACRGLIELEVEVRGKSGHSSNPSNGKNAIALFSQIMWDLNKKLEKMTEKDLGYPSLNVAYIKGGLFKERKKDGVVLGRNGNNIADYIESTIELRTNTKIDLTWVTENLEVFAKKYGVALYVKKVRHNLKTWNSNQKQLDFLVKKVEKINKNVSFADAGVTGYVDIAMLAESFNALCCTIGAKGANGHAIGEHVEIESLDVLYHILRSVI